MEAYSLGPPILELASSVLGGYTLGNYNLGACSLRAYIHVSITEHVHECFFSAGSRQVKKAVIYTSLICRHTVYNARATDSGFKYADTSNRESTVCQSTVWESTVWESTISGHRFWITLSTHLELGVYCSRVYSLVPPIFYPAEHSPGTESLQSGSLQSRATDFGSSGAFTWDWESTVWESTISGHRF